LTPELRKSGYVYNNTVFDCFRGIEARETVGRLVAKNNIAISTQAQAFFDYLGNGEAFSPMSSHNVSSDATAGDIGPAILTGATAEALFLSIAEGAEDLHLRPDAQAVLGRAEDLSDDPVLAVVDDIDGTLRPAGTGWDPGADER
jgi:hypothetical protein